ncbi:ABC transporter permease (plasmid) [Fulvitalea axinellae]|uniref:ABC transporter permease n=1 Tax=Fulvitalea axinellae TaxID=1182444 RepID=A0AAU9CHB1_9BACT|nr:ABC transporter permease [Fulvitalea axinellae]
MLFYYLKISIRRLLRDRVYSVVNLMGLVLAFVAGLMLFGYAFQAWRTDKGLSNNEQVFHLLVKSEEQAPYWYSGAPYFLSETLAGELPQIQNYTRLKEEQLYLNRAGGKERFKGKVYSTERSFFDIYRFSLLAGSFGEFEHYSGKAVISERMAKRFFGDASAIGKFLPLKDNEDNRYQVVAIMENATSRSSLQADILITFPKTSNEFAYRHKVETSLLLAKGTDSDALVQAIRNIRLREGTERVRKERWTLLPFEDLYLSDLSISGFRNRGNRLYVIGTVAIGVFVLVIALLNVAVSRSVDSEKRRTSDKVRACMGENRKEAWLFTVIELGLLVSVAGALALPMATFLYPWVNRWIGFSEIDTLAIDGRMAVFYVLSLIVCVLILFISSRPFLRRKYSLHTALQLVAGIALLISSGIYLKQIGLMESSFDFFKEGERIAYFRLPHHNKDLDAPITLPWRQDLDMIPEVRTTGRATVLPLRFGGIRHVELRTKNGPEQTVQAVRLTGDDRFTSLYHLELLRGRALNPATFPKTRREKYYSDSPRTVEVLVNEMLVKRLGLEDAPLGRQLRLKKGDTSFKIVGVLRDFHFAPIHMPIEPVFVSAEQLDLQNVMLARIPAKQVPKAKESLRKIYNKYDQGKSPAFSLRILEGGDYYKSELRFGKILTVFTSLGMLIVMLGLFGVSYFTAETRTKEIGIRKANGATTFEILRLLNSSTLKQVAMAFIIAVPIAYYAMGRWLENFAYKTEMSWWIFAGAGLLAGLVALATVSWQSWRAASREPVEALRYE